MYIPDTEWDTLNNFCADLLEQLEAMPEDIFFACKKEAIELCYAILNMQDAEKKDDEFGEKCFSIEKLKHITKFTNYTKMKAILSYKPIKPYRKIKNYMLVPPMEFIIEEYDTDLKGIYISFEN